MQPHHLVYVIFVVTFVLQQQSLVVITKPNILTIFFFFFHRKRLSTPGLESYSLMCRSRTNIISTIWEIFKNVESQAQPPVC